MMQLYYVDDGVPEATTHLLRQACNERDVEFISVHPLLFDYAPERQLHGGELLYRPAISLAAIRVEQFLYQEDVATFYATPESIFFASMNPTLVHQRAGIPIPRTVYCSTTNRDVLRSFVDRLGGFPIIMKMPGFSTGIGVMRIDSFPSLFSLVDYTVTQGRSPLLCAYVNDAVHWRLIVVGDRVVAAYKNVQRVDDFRSFAADDASHYQMAVPPEMEAMAVRACQVLYHEFGGVDVLEHPSGRLYLLEANFPCYFAHAQETGNIDVAGAMIDHLKAKAVR